MVPCRRYCYNYNYYYYYVVRYLQIKTPQLNYNEFKLKEERKHRNARMSKYKSSWRSSAPKQTVGMEKVKKKLPTNLLSVYHEMMHNLHNRDWKNAMNKLQKSIDRDKQSHNVVLYTVAIRACCVSGKFNEAIKLYQQMYDENKIRPDEITLIAMLKGCSIIRDWDSAQIWFDKIIKDGDLEDKFKKPELKLSVFSLIISSANQFTWQKAWECFKNLRDNDDEIELDIIIYNAMLDVLARGKQYKLSKDLFEEIKNNDNLKWQIDVHTFESLIRSCIYNGDWLEAFNYIQLMQSNKYNFNVTKHVISDVLRCIKYYKGESNAFDKAKKLWNQVIDFGIDPDAIMFGIMIDLCYKYNDFQYGLQLFRDMITIYNIKPTTIVFNNLLKCCIVESKSSEYLLKLLNDMKQVYDLEPDEFTYNILLNAMIKLTNKELNDSHNLNINEKYMIITKLLTFWNDTIEIKNEISYSSIIHALFDLNKNYFIIKDKGNIINQQLLTLYHNGYNEGHLAHWAPNNSYFDYKHNNDNCWILEMHGWSKNVAIISLQYFFQMEIPILIKENTKDLLISVGKGDQSQNNIPILKDAVIQFLYDDIGISRDINITNNHCIFVDRNDIKVYCQQTNTTSCAVT